MIYGLPYKGSKNKIASFIIEEIAKKNQGKFFVDLFGGGGAITHCAATSMYFEKVFYNEYDKLCFDYFRNAATGNNTFDKKHFVSREEFEEKKDVDPVIRYCWSFGNNGRTYLYGKKIEVEKRALHNAVFGDFSELENIFNGITNFCKYSLTYKERYIKIKSFVRSIKERVELQSLQSLERLQSLKSLERLERLQSLEFSNKSYCDVIIPENAVIYCDPPYKNTDKYNVDFDYDHFEEWANKQHNIYISEYTCPKGFEVIASKEKRSLLDRTGKNKIVTELLCYKH